MGIIALEGILIFAYHGIHASEKHEGNRFVVDVYLHGPIADSGSGDQITKTSDYEVVYAKVKEAFVERVNLLETLVVRIGDLLKKQFPHVKQIKVRVSKLNPPVGGEVNRAFVEEDFLQ
jgi:7,8-dihydroneopterin aldolase/epimerase/oxygenase